MLRFVPKLGYSLSGSVISVSSEIGGLEVVMTSGGDHRAGVKLSQVMLRGTLPINEGQTHNLETA